MNYAEWVKSVPEEITGDALWRIEVYRLALFISEIGRYDVTRLVAEKRTLQLSDQLYRSLGSIGANIAEGYSRGSNKDRVRFYEYALGSARESRDWYYKAKHILGDEIASHRIQLVTQIIRLLLTTLPQQRGYRIKEDRADYEVFDASTEETNLTLLLQNAPLPQ